MFDFLDTSFKRRAFAKALKEVEQEGYYINQYYAEQNVAVLEDNSREIADLNNTGEKKEAIKEQVLDLATLNEKHKPTLETEKIAPTLSNGMVLEPVETLQTAETNTISESEVEEAYRIARERASAMQASLAAKNAMQAVKTEHAAAVEKSGVKAEDKSAYERAKEARRNEIRQLFLSSIINKSNRDAEKAKAASELSAAIAKNVKPKETPAPVVVAVKTVEKPKKPEEKPAIAEPIKEAVKKVVRKTATPRKRRRRYDADIIGGYY